MAQLLEQLEELIQPILEEQQLELVDIEYRREDRGWILRFYLDKEGGINLDDCAAASREISALLDVENLIETAFNLEVSSPGIERPLKRAKDYERFSGQLVRIKTLVALDPAQQGRKRKTFVGTLNGLQGQQIQLTLKEKQPVQVMIDLDQIEAAHLEFEFN